MCWNDAAKQQEESVYKRSFWTGEGWAPGGWTDWLAWPGQGCPPAPV